MGWMVWCWLMSVWLRRLLLVRGWMVCRLLVLLCVLIIVLVWFVVGLWMLSVLIRCWVCCVVVVVCRCC